MIDKGLLEAETGTPVRGCPKPGQTPLSPPVRGQGVWVGTSNPVQRTGTGFGVWRCS